MSPRPKPAARRTLRQSRSRLRTTMRDDTFAIALQPIIDLDGGRIAGLEALSRFPDGRSPDTWFGQAHDAGLALDLDRAAFTKALALLPLLPERFHLSVNVTPDLLLSREPHRQVLNRAVPADRLVIEITEHARVSDYGDLRAALAPLRQRGVQIAVDDAGAGYASFAHVLELRPSIVKLDRSLVTNISGDPARRALVSALVHLAGDLGQA